jgi:glycosyltransferase involved in cell wall biosynthesis
MHRFLSERPKILQLCAVDFTVYHFILPLMRAQRDWGFEVEAACTPGEFVGAIESEGFKVHPIPISRSFNLAAHFQSYRALRALFTREKFAAVHAHTPVAALIGRPAARRSGIPVVVYTAHGFYFHERMHPLVRRAHIALERWAQRYADFLLTQSAEDRQTAIETRIATADRSLAIGNGVDTKLFRPDLIAPAERAAVRAEFGLTPADGPLITMMGRLVREKGYFELVEAWSRVHAHFPKARALFIGDALPSDREDSAARLRERIRELKLENSITLAGLRRDVPRLLAASDIFILPSWREGMPRSILEAMASGLPVIATNIRGCREEVIEGETGFLVPVQDPNAIAEALTLLIGDAQLRAAMGRASRLRAQSEFDERLVIHRQEKIFRQLFNEKSLPWPGSPISK